MANPRKAFVDMLGKHDPAAMEQLVLDLDTIGEPAFAEVCALAGKLAKTVDIKDAVLAAQVEVDKKPKKEAQADATLK